MVVAICFYYLFVGVAIALAAALILGALTAALLFGFAASYFAVAVIQEEFLARAIDETP